MVWDSRGTLKNPFHKDIPGIQTTDPNDQFTIRVPSTITAADAKNGSWFNLYRYEGCMATHGSLPIRVAKSTPYDHRSYLAEEADSYGLPFRNDVCQI